MNILAIETSSSVCSVALQVGEVVLERSEIAVNRHSQVLLEFVDELLTHTQINVKQLDAIAVGNGPGSFTGLRLGLGVSQGLAFGVSKPIIPISSLHAIALQAESKAVFVAVDARMNEVYWQCFCYDKQDNLSAIDKVRLDRPDDININSTQYDYQGVGSGFDTYTNELCRHLQDADNWIKNIQPDAKAVLKLALIRIEQQGMPDTQVLTPAYVRDNVTQ